MGEDLEGKIKFAEGVLKGKRERLARELKRLQDVVRSSGSDDASKGISQSLRDRIGVLENEIASDESHLDDLRSRQKPVSPQAT